MENYGKFFPVEVKEDFSPDKYLIDAILLPNCQYSRIIWFRQWASIDNDSYLRTIFFRTKYIHLDVQTLFLKGSPLRFSQLQLPFVVTYSRVHLSSI